MFKPQYGFASVIVLSCMVLGYVVFHPSSLPRLVLLYQEKARLEKAALQLSEQIEQKNAEVHLLTSSSPSSNSYLERVAREELLMLKPNEQVITPQILQKGNLSK